MYFTITHLFFSLLCCIVYLNVTKIIVDVRNLDKDLIERSRNRENNEHLKIPEISVLRL